MRASHDTIRLISGAQPGLFFIIILGTLSVFSKRVMKELLILFCKDVCVQTTLLQVKSSNSGDCVVINVWDLYAQKTKTKMTKFPVLTADEKYPVVLP